MFELYRQCIEPDIRNEWKDASEGFLKQQIESGVEWMEYLAPVKKIRTLDGLAETAVSILRSEGDFVDNYLPNHPGAGFMVSVDEEKGIICQSCEIDWGEPPSR